jgi:thiol-disulfide isomerase/thioredoxin
MNTSLVLGAAGLMLLLGLGFIYMLAGTPDRRRVLDGLGWMGVGLSSVLVGVALLLLLLAFQARSALDEARAAATAQTVEDAVLNLPANNFAFELVKEGTRTDLDAYRGKVVLLNFWATWCAPCLIEAPDLNQLQEAYRDSGLVVLSVSDEPREDLLTFDRQTPMRTVSARVDSPDVLPASFKGGLDVRPTTYLIDREGTVRRYLLGARDFAFFQEALQPLL